ncbi:MAG: Txe/YoeB family addiction module toxin [Mycobacteriaceae bacterium]
MSAIDVVWAPEAWSDYIKLQADDKRMARKLGLIVTKMSEGKVDSIGKTERLKHDLSGCLSVRVDRKNRVVFNQEPDSIRILSCSGHYR